MSDELESPATREQIGAHMREQANVRWNRTAKARAANAHARDALSGGEPHPLFPTEPSEPIPRVEWINIARFERRGTVDCPRVFAAEELTSLDDISNMYGGGSYELRGRCSGTLGQPGPLVKRVRYKIDGRSLPFISEEESDAEEGNAPAPAPSASASTPDPMMMFIAMMKESAAEARASSDRQMQLLVAMMAQSQQQQTASMQAIAQLMTAALTAKGDGPDVAALLTAAASMSSAQLAAVTSLMPRPQSSDPLDQLGKMLEISKAVGAGGGKSDSLTDLLAGFGQAAAGIAELERAGAASKAAASQPAPATQAPPPPEPEPEPLPLPPPPNGASSTTPQSRQARRNELESIE
jgi:hypothetical protein